MKTLKVLITLLACVGFACAMDNWRASSSAAADVEMAVRLPACPVCIATLDNDNLRHEIVFAPLQVTKSGFLQKKLKNVAPTDSETVTIDLSEDNQAPDNRRDYTQAPYLRYETLLHILTLIDFKNGDDVAHYLDEMAPEAACLAVLALNFFDAQQSLAWAHAYLIRHLISDHVFTIRCLSLPGVCKNIEQIMALDATKSTPESVRLLTHMLWENRLIVEKRIAIPVLRHCTHLNPNGTSLAIVLYHHGLPPRTTLYRTTNLSQIGKSILGEGFRFSYTGLLLAVRQGIVPDHASPSGIMLHRTQDGNQVGKLIMGAEPTLSDDGSFLTTTQAIDGSFYVVLYRTSDGNQIGEPMPGTSAVFSDDSSLLAVARYNSRVVLYRTSDGSRVEKAISGYDPVFSPDNLLLAVTDGDADAGNERVVLHRTSDGSQFGTEIPGWDPTFTPGGALLITQGDGHFEFDRNERVVMFHTNGNGQDVEPIPGWHPELTSDGRFLAAIQREGTDTCLAWYRTSDGTRVGKISGVTSDLGRIFSPDNLLLKVATHNGQSIYFADDASGLLHNAQDIQFAANGTIVYEDHSWICCMQPLSLRPIEYLLALVAIHQGPDIDEITWTETFANAPERLREFVHEKTGKFVS